MMKRLAVVAAVMTWAASTVTAYSGQGVACASLVVIDGDTIKCDGQNMRLLGGGVPFKSGVDAPEMGSRAKCNYERALALKAPATRQYLSPRWTGSWAGSYGGRIGARMARKAPH